MRPHIQKWPTTVLVQNAGFGCQVVCPPVSNTARQGERLTDGANIEAREPSGAAAEEECPAAHPRSSPRRSASAISSRASATVVATGFSEYTCFPAANTLVVHIEVSVRRGLRITSIPGSEMFGPLPPAADPKVHRQLLCSPLEPHAAQPMTLNESKAHTFSTSCLHPAPHSRRLGPSSRAPHRKHLFPESHRPLFPQSTRPDERRFCHSV